MYKWKDDMKHPGYEPELICAKANVDHTISCQGTAVSALDNSPTTPMADIFAMVLSRKPEALYKSNVMIVNQIIWRMLIFFNIQT